MKISVKIIISIIVIAIIGCIIALVLPNNHNENDNDNSNFQNNTVENSNTEFTSQIKSVEDLKVIIDKIYENIDENELPELETTDVDVTSIDTVKTLTGLENGNDLEYLVISQPLMNAQAYSLVLAKAKNIKEVDNIAKTMCNSVDTRRWICVEAEKVIASSNDDVVFMIMADKDIAEKIYNNFKNLPGQIGEVYTKDAEEIVLPEDMY